MKLSLKSNWNLRLLYYSHIFHFQKYILASYNFDPLFPINNNKCSQKLKIWQIQKKCQISCDFLVYGTWQPISEDLRACKNCLKTRKTHLKMNEVDNHFKSGVQLCLKAFLKDNVQGKWFYDFFSRTTFLSINSLQKKNCQILSMLLKELMSIMKPKIWDFCQSLEAVDSTDLLPFTRKTVWISWKMTRSSICLLIQEIWRSSLVPNTNWQDRRDRIWPRI